jgi:nucleoside-diphosphate-sugar epimerase
MRKVLVTGHNGYIGVHLTRLLKEEGYFVIGLDTNYFGDDCRFSDYIRPDQEIVKDIRLVSDHDLRGLYAVCHLAALSNDPMGTLNEDLTYEINHRASVNLAIKAKDAGVEKFLFSSSCSMYGISEEDSALDETAAFSPVTAYAMSKVRTEQDVKPLVNEDFSVTFLRNSTAYGISPKLRVDLVVNNLIGWAVTTGQIRIMSDGTPWRPLIHAEDIARAFAAVIKAPKEAIKGKSYNIGKNSENYRIRDIANMIKEVIPGCEVIISGEYGSDSRSYKVDFTKVEMELPEFRPKWNLYEGIEEIYKSYLIHGMNDELFNGRHFIRLKQLEYLLAQKKINEQLFWR